MKSVYSRAANRISKNWTRIPVARPKRLPHGRVTVLRTGYKSCKSRLKPGHGAYPKTRDPAEPRAGDDAAADAGHQAAAALQPGPRRLCGGGARAQSAAGAHRRRGGGEGERRAANHDAAPAAGAAADWAEAARADCRARSRSKRRRAREHGGRAGGCSARRLPTPRASRSNGETPAGYSEWAGTGTGGRDGGDYNLEAFVSAETTLADHLAEQLALAVADPARRMIGQYLIDLVDEAGYLSRRSRAGRREARRAACRGRRRAGDPAGLRSAGRVRAQSHRMPRHPAQGARPLRSRDGGAGRHISICSPSASSRRLRRICARERGGSHRHDRRDSPAQPEARPRLRVDPGAADRAGRVRAHRPRRRLPHRAQFRHAAEGAGQSALPRRDRQDREERRRTSPISPTACRPRPG